MKTLLVSSFVSCVVGIAITAVAGACGSVPDITFVDLTSDGGGDANGADGGSEAAASDGSAIDGNVPSSDGATGCPGATPSGYDGCCGSTPCKGATCVGTPPPACTTKCASCLASEYCCARTGTSMCKSLAQPTCN